MAVAMELDRAESREGRRLEKFTIKGTDFVDLKDGNVLIVVRGMVNGMQLAFRRICPKELLPVKGEEGGYEIGGFMQGLRDMARSTAGRVLQAAGVGCAAMAGACAPSADIDHNSDHNSPEMSGQFRTDEKALTGSDISHFGTPQPVPWSEWGDDSIEITEYEGKKVIIFNRWVGEGDDGYDGIFYVECNELEKCITEGVPQEIQGLQESFPAFWISKMPDYPLPPDYLASFGEGIIFKNADGQYQLLTGAEKLSILADIEKNQDGVFEASDFKSPPSYSGGTGPVPVDGVPHLVHGDPVELLDLHTWEDKEIGNIPTTEECGGAPHWSEEGSWVVDAKGKYVQGKPVCEFVSAASLEDLINNVGVKYLKNINDYNKTALGAWDPRIGQNVFIYVVQGPKGPKLYYALIEPYCGNGKADEGETFANCPQDVPQPPLDIVTNPPDADAGSTTGPETIVGAEIGQDTWEIDTDSLDAALAETMKEVDVAVADDGAAAPDNGVDEKGADTQPDTKQPDTEQPCDFAEEAVNITEGECLFKDCDNPSVTVSGTCTAEVDLGGSKPVVLEIDGEYSLDMLEKVGVLLSGNYEVDDKGTGFDTDFGKYGITPKGTVYGGEEAVKGDPDVYKVWCKEGKIIVSYDGEEIAVLNAGDKVTYIKGEPVVPVQPEEEEDTLQPDSGQPDTIQPDTGKDTGTSSGEDGGNSADTSKPSKDTVQLEEGGGGGGGCNCSTVDHPQTAASILAGLALLALVGKLKTSRMQAVRAGRRETVQNIGTGIEEASQRIRAGIQMIAQKVGASVRMVSRRIRARV